MSLVNEIFEMSKNKLNAWKDSYGYAPMDTAIKLDNAMLSWMQDLTYALRHWEILAELGELDMSEGDLILAYANLGSLVESWLKFFYTVHYWDYRKTAQNNQNLITKSGKMIEPEKMEFEDLKQLSRGIIWTKDKKDSWFLWVGKIQERRNAIHSFSYREIGNPDEFLKDLSKYKDFLEKIFRQLPEDPYWE